MARDRIRGPRFRHRFAPYNGRSQRVLSREELRLLLLTLIDAQERHGYELIRRIKSISKGRYAPSSGMVYPALADLEEAGFAVHSESDGGRKVYVATESGMHEAEVCASEVAEIRSRLEALGASTAPESASIGRALANLEMVLANAIPGADEEREDEIVGLIDATARQIERLGR